MKHQLQNTPPTLSPDYPMGLTSAIHFLSINGYVIGDHLNYGKLTSDAVELAAELAFCGKEDTPFLFLQCAEMGKTNDCFQIVRTMYQRYRIRLPEKIRAFAAVTWLWKDYLRMVTAQLAILLAVCEEDDQIYELEEYEE